MIIPDQVSEIAICQHHERENDVIALEMLKFTPDLFIDVPEIDNQHKVLFNRLNVLIELGDNAIRLSPEINKTR